MRIDEKWIKLNLGGGGKYGIDSCFCQSLKLLLLSIRLVLLSI